MKTYKGRKVLVREMEENDAPFIVKWRNDPEIQKWLFSQNKLNLEDHLEWFRKEKPGRFDYIVCDKDNLKPIGAISLTQRDSDSAEASVLIGDKSYWGKGYAKEALEIRLMIGFEVLGLKTMYLRMMTDNIRIIRLNEKLGFRVVDNSTYEISKSNIVKIVKMELTSKEYAARK